MAIDLYWDDEQQTVMLAEFNGKWTWDELHTVLKTIKRISQERNQVFGAIIDVRDGLQVPGGALFSRETLNNFRKLMTLSDDGRQGPVVVLGVSGMIKTVFDTVKNFDAQAVQNVSFAQEMDDARRIIYTEMAKLNGRSSASA